MFTAGEESYRRGKCSNQTRRAWGLTFKKYLRAV